MTSLSVRPFHKIGIDDPQGIKPDEHELYEYDNYSEVDSDYTTIDQDTETSSDISEIDEMPVYNFKKRIEKPKKTYTLILQEEDFLPE